MLKDRRTLPNTPPSADKAEEIRYLKWDLQKFLAVPGTSNLTVNAKAEVERLANWLGKFNDNRDSPMGLNLGLELLRIAADQFKQAMAGLGQLEPSGECHVTPRERLLKADFVQVLDRIANVTSLLRQSA